MGPDRVVLPLTLRFNIAPPADFQFGVCNMKIENLYDSVKLNKDCFTFLNFKKLFCGAVEKGDMLNIVFYRESHGSLRIMFGTDQKRAEPLYVQINEKMDTFVFQCEEKFLNSSLIELLDTHDLLNDAPPSDSSCVVCHDRKSTVACIPCGHIVYCTTCAKHQLNFCPVCNKVVNDQVEVGFKAKRCMNCLDVKTCKGIGLINLPCGCVTHCETASDYTQYCLWCGGNIDDSIKFYLS
ncbi:unnamed protein product [Bursaphelenchus okinawaensis]|uniref:RING-type domain-containing protein n=1 Tax=Bursaphelenchus okinawaensis TaxID=465554 RepID=A0A811L321_9BILA|nr:unnamed protein product [Bursaphelenchus okinawaensis]CAG9115442.1 unnamed protein product [Bursaphelenchus okinawaensis]